MTSDNDRFFPSGNEPGYARDNDGLPKNCAAASPEVCQLSGGIEDLVYLQVISDSSIRRQPHCRLGG
jgi:hypothetical protein